MHPDAPIQEPLRGSPMRKPGDFVVYRMPKQSTHPGPRAKDVYAAAHGDTYSYFVEKFWIVAEVREDNKLLLRTRRGKEHLVDADDPNLRHASWWSRLIWRGRFPKLPNE